MDPLFCISGSCMLNFHSKAFLYKFEACFQKNEIRFQLKRNKLEWLGKFKLLISWPTFIAAYLISFKQIDANFKMNFAQNETHKLSNGSPKAEKKC